MRDPERWIDGASGNTEILRLLKASKDAGPTLAEKAALGARLGVSTSGLWLTPTLKALLASGGIAAAVIAYQALGPRTQTQAPETPAVSSAPVRQVDPVTVVPQATLTTKPKQQQASTAPSIESSEGRASATSGVTPRSPSKSTPGAKQASARRLPTEAQLLSQARHALESAPKKALALIEAHEKNYPRGVLTQEREVLKVKALQNLGRTEAAAATEKKFRTEHPESIHHVGSSE